MLSTDSHCSSFVFSYVARDNQADQKLLELGWFGRVERRGGGDWVGHYVVWEDGGVGRRGRPECLVGLRWEWHGEFGPVSGGSAVWEWMEKEN